MGLAEDLLSQAHHLVSLDPKRPKQASLRRAISTSYYAVFHLLTANAALRFIPKRPYGLVARVERALSHQEMKKACQAFNNKPLAEPLLTLVGETPSDQLRNIASAFIELQEKRHKADYDTAASFSRNEAEALLAKAESIFVTWREIENTDEATVFLAALAFGARWSK
jgi:uncharacterized protein (UPF0332 family)